MTRPGTILNQLPQSHPVVSIVVPTYREAANLEELVERISQTLNQVEELFEIIIVDDASRDGTDHVVDELRRHGHPVRLIERQEERGLSSAVLRGFREAHGDLLVCMDADLSHPPETLPQLLAPIRLSTAEMVMGSRYVDGGQTDAAWSRFRRWNSRLATWLARPFTRIRDPLAGYFALPKSVFLRTAAWDPIGYKIGLEILVKAGCRNVAEVPIHFADRKRGSSKLTIKEQCNYLRHLLRLGKFKFQTWFQAAQFGFVGALGAAVDLLAYVVLMAAGVSIPLARAFAIGVAICWNFWGNERWTFRPLGGSVLVRFRKFICACGLGAAVNYGTTLIAAMSWPEGLRNPVLVAGVGIALGAGVNFWCSWKWVFRPADDRLSFQLGARCRQSQ